MVTELSILIPVFNQDVTPIVHTLLAQCNRLSIRYEILVYDDGSEESIRNLNRPLVEHKGIVYKELPQNIGRAAIRNQLATNARFPHLLMLDNDCLPVSPNFLHDYLIAAEQSEVVIGGIVYVSKMPDRPYRLHWKYGKARGAKSASERQQHPYTDIFLCNALIKRSLFLKFPLHETLKKYGHEDTVFAHELKRNQVAIHHIQNPVVHLGLEKTPIMLSKTHEALDNLVQLYHEGEKLEQLKLIKTYKLLRDLGLISVYTSFFSNLEKLVHYNLNSAYPNLLLYDLYRLYILGKRLDKVQAAIN